MATTKVLSVVLAVAMFLTLMTFAVVGAGETTGMAVGASALEVTRANARATGSGQMVALAVYHDGVRVASTIESDGLSNEFEVPGSFNLTEGDLQRNNGRYRFNSGFRMDETHIEVLARNGVGGPWFYIGMMPDNGTQRLRDRWNLGVNITTSRVWASVGINNNGSLNLDSHAVLNATGGVTANDRITLTLDGRRARGQELRLTVEANASPRLGIEENDEIIYMDDVYRRLRVYDFINRATIYTDLDGIITTRLHQRDYFIQVTNRPTVAQMDIMDYFNFETIRVLHHTGLPATATITWDLDYNFWVYTVVDGAIQFLGRSSAQLPLADVYFFSAVELAVTGGDAPVEEPGEGFVPPADGGPVGNLPNNNFNPNTGR